MEICRFCGQKAEELKRIEYGKYEYGVCDTCHDNLVVKKLHSVARCRKCGNVFFTTRVDGDFFETDGCYICTTGMIYN